MQRGPWLGVFGNDFDTGGLIVLGEPVFESPQAARSAFDDGPIDLFDGPFAKLLR